MIADGFTERVSDTTRKDEQVLYLPHHGVHHINKPGKLRVIFDCLRKYKGICLNDCLLPGLNITNTLLGVFFRFRRGLYAIQGDIRNMFHMVGVSEHHRDSGVLYGVMKAILQVNHKSIACACSYLARCVALPVLILHCNKRLRTINQSTKRQQLRS